jgi:hypothetical protein
MESGIMTAACRAGGNEIRFGCNFGCSPTVAATVRKMIYIDLNTRSDLYRIGDQQEERKVPVYAERRLFAKQQELGQVQTR